MAGKMASRKRKEKAFNLLAFFVVLILAALGASTNLVDIPVFFDEYGYTE
ncbi:MAG: hypothetical protein ACLRIP_11215 [Blautia massiliensis (ex Durand et al. 2017)]